jgi:hypothetical protein
MKLNEKQFCDFLVKAKKAGYASSNFFNKTIEKDKSKTIVFKLGDWKYNDNYFGGEPYGGREVVFYKNQPIYMMVYYGSVDKSVKDFKKVYKFLREALNLIPEDKPFRGPKFYKNEDYAYRNWFSGDINNFSGVEKIYFGKKKIYEAKYLGGLVDQRNEKNG